MAPVRSLGAKQSDLAVLACIGCRRQHLKCDGKRPTCSRCARKGQTCHYQPSRRGGRRKAHPPPSPRAPGSIPLESVVVDEVAATASSTRAVSTTSMTNSPPPTRPMAFHSTAPAVVDDTTIGSELPRNTSPSLTTPGTQSAFSSGENTSSHHQQLEPNFLADFPWVEPLPAPMNHIGSTEPILFSCDPGHDGDRFLRLYYENFHNAHPFLVPNPLYSSRAYPAFLRLVVEFAGSHYGHSDLSEQLKSKAMGQLQSTSDTSTCMVQAYLIMSIVLFSRGEFEEAHDAFGRCTALAFDIGMNRADFIPSQQPETSIEAESLRRTWWELYITDIMLSIPKRTISFHCSTVSLDVSLPCEEALYTGSHPIPIPHKIQTFKRRVLAAEDVVFTSFSYRIEAAGILSRVLILNRLKDHHRDHLQAVENALVSWSSNLPVEKTNIVDSYSNMDEMMFQAHAYMAYASMLLHLPRSQFYPLLSNTQDAFLPFTHLHSSSASTRIIQSIKTTNASKRISDYISLCPNIQRHTPFIIPALTICGLIQLATANTHSDECFEHHYHRVTMVLGCLKGMKRTWFLANHAHNQLRSRAETLISDSVDRWNAEPMERSIAFAQTSPSETRHSSAASLSQASTAHGAAVILQVDPSLHDSFDCSAFSAFADFQDPH